MEFQNGHNCFNSCHGEEVDCGHHHESLGFLDEKEPRLMRHSSVPLGIAHDGVDDLQLLLGGEEGLGADRAHAMPGHHQPLFRVPSLPHMLDSGLSVSEQQRIGAANKMKGKKKTTGPVHNSKYKAKLCKNWVQNGLCPYYEKCQFAHGEHEIQKWAVRRHRLREKQRTASVMSYMNVSPSFQQPTQNIPLEQYNTGLPAYPQINNFVDKRSPQDIFRLMSDMQQRNGGYFNPGEVSKLLSLMGEARNEEQQLRHERKVSFVNNQNLCMGASFDSVSTEDSLGLFQNRLEEKSLLSKEMNKFNFPESEFPQRSEAFPTELDEAFSRMRF